MAYEVTKRTLLMSAGLFGAWQASPAHAWLGTSDRAPLPDRVEALLRKMTVAEKAGQLTLMPAFSTSASINALNPTAPSKGFAAQLEDARAGRLMGVFNPRNLETARQLQTAAVKESRLGIPLMFGADVLHGYRTVFPVPLGEAASFDPSLAERTARAAAEEMSANGIDWTFAPMVDIARDARWGRGVEGAGEDILLGNQMAAARVKGFQGSSLRADDAVLSCPKHFAAYGAGEGGLDYNTVDVSEHTLREVYLPPFKAAFDSGALSTMVSFNELSGVPATANAWLLEQVLRREWAFEGFVVTDYTGDRELVAHGYAADEREAAKLAFLAGVDVSMASGLFLQHLPALVASGEVPMRRLDQAVRRVLATKVKLGLFDDPFRRIVTERESARIRTPAHLQLAREAARRSVVMLKNDGGLLPLPSAGRRIALIGPFAEGMQGLNGPWTPFGSGREAVDLATGLRSALSDPALLDVRRGCDIESALDGELEAAVEAARAADVVVLAVGESESMSGEGQSRAEAVLPAPQQALAEAVAAVGKPMVVVLKNGRALALQGAVLAAPAILVTWFLGSETGNAIADILFGIEGPSGRLPVSFPRIAGQVPYYYAHKSSGRPNLPGKSRGFTARYREGANFAQFPFGHGLTYGDVAYSEILLDRTTVERGARLRVSATLTNNGSRPAQELAQFYLRDVAASLTRPVRELKAYQHISLSPGESRRVDFELTTDQLGFLGPDMKPRTEAGDFLVWIAPSAEAEGVTSRFTLVARP